ETKAPPHASDRGAVVHNGIIENFEELRHELTGLGHQFGTETDTEVVVHLLTRYLQEQKTPEQAMAAAMERLHGAFALAVIFAGRHDLLIGARRGSPLAVGFGDGEMYLGSDALALASLTRRICYLEEDDWAVLTPAGATVYHDGKTVERAVTQTALSGALMGRGNSPPFMRKGPAARPAVRAAPLHTFLTPLQRRIELPALPFAFADFPRLTIVACGTASLAGMVGKYWFE